MSIYSKCKNALKLIYDEHYRWTYLAGQGKYDDWDDEKFIRKTFECRMGKKLNLNNPRTMNEKLQWLKLNYRKELMTTLVDKYRVREYVSNILGAEYLIPLLGVWKNPYDIDFSILPSQFVIKCNHNSGLGMCICKNKKELDIDKVRKSLQIGIAQDYYKTGREWPYKNVPRRIIAEEYMEDSKNSDELTDYKFMCFDGHVDCVMVCFDRNSGDTKYYFFDKEWNLKRYNIRGINAPEGFTINKPSNMDEMFSIAEKLSKGFPFVRVDLYSVNGKTYFGEMTFYPQSGFDKNLLYETDLFWGSLIDINKLERGKN